ncbi:MAG: glycosyltransferase family 2 protein [Deltaproteobacteria bacterium]|nr:glycosyltransferase family 2 protein [Deltaproteobacteria bacterium]
MKLVIIIPCLNEERTLPLVLETIPTHIEGIAEIEIVVVDDGSTDKTSEVASQMGVNYIVSFTHNRGLATAFAAGLETALMVGADIIVNTDADNQYPQQDIPKLIAPILQNRADIVIANRQVNKIPHFSIVKKLLQQFGSWTVRRLSGVNVPDAPSGFRAYSREAAMSLNIITGFSYVLETIIQATEKGLSITSVPIVTNPKTRESRLFSNIYEHILRSSGALLRVYAMYKPLKVFSYVGMVCLGLAFILIARYGYFFFFVPGGRAGHVQSLIAAVILSVIGFQVFTLGLVADLIAINRKLLEDTLLKTKKMTMNRDQVGVKNDKEFDAKF